MREVVVVLRGRPLERGYGAEACRVAVGLTQAANRPTLLCLEDGMEAVGPLGLEVELARHLSRFARQGVGLAADAAALAERGLTAQVPDARVLEHAACLELLARADRVVVFR